MGISQLFVSSYSRTMRSIIAAVLVACVQGYENVHVSGYKAPTKVFAMPYGAYGAGSYGGYGAGYGSAAAAYERAYGNVNSGYRAIDSHSDAAYAPASSYNSAYAPASSYASAYAPVEGYAASYAPAADYRAASSYAPEYSTGYGSYGAGVSAYAPASSYNTGYGSYAAAGYGYGNSYAPKDGKLVSVIDRSHGYGNVKYAVPTPFLSNSAYGPAKH